ncbi:hypothetical protein BZM27_51405 [Paraburkholderia steynii]|uniref:Uncharacterized protein n=1 Tax=Paraburkholderia steynii TaxID=1245441 RepID=A0A4V2NG04_9BURK|nr:hypothetical protein BZM27_51405 [Paraburkholderia steynii]
MLFSPEWCVYGLKADTQFAALEGGKLDAVWMRQRGVKQVMLMEQALRRACVFQFGVCVYGLTAYTQFAALDGGKPDAVWMRCGV